MESLEARKNNVLIKFVRVKTNEEFYIGENYDWRLQKNGLSDFASYDSKLTVVQDYDRDGGSIAHQRLEDKKRTIKICNIDWQNAEIYRNTVRTFFNYGENYKLYITVGDTSRWAEGVLYRMAMDEPTNNDYLLKVTMSFEFDSPYFKSVDNFGKNIASLEPYWAFPWISRYSKNDPERLIGTTGGIFNFERVVTLSNYGDRVAYPIINIFFTSDVLNPKVSINDGFIRILGTFDEDDSITIDYSVNPPRVTRNGENILGMCDKESKFDDMYIQIGENIIAFDADNGTDEMAVYVYYYKLYTSI